MKKQTESFREFQKELGKHIQQMRKSRQLSQEDVAALLGMDRVSIGYIEQGKRAPKLSTLYRLAEAFGVHIGEFFKAD
jgi:transcriptional regulator with XRE-family HTH domain